MKHSFEYFLNAIHYCLWLGDMKFGDFVGAIVNKLLSPIPKYLFTKEYKKKYEERLIRERKSIDSFFLRQKIWISYRVGQSLVRLFLFWVSFICFIRFRRFSTKRVWLSEYKPKAHHTHSTSRTMLHTSI